jgi:uncharacterized protein YjiS (DUF1127 family)
MLRRAETRPADTARRLVAYRLVAHRLVDWLLGALERQRERRMLLALDERMLRDVGITRADALREGGKPFWQS